MKKGLNKFIYWKLKRHFLKGNRIIRPSACNIRLGAGGWGPRNKVGAQLHDSLGPASNLYKIFCVHIEKYTQNRCQCVDLEIAVLLNQYSVEDNNKNLNQEKKHMGNTYSISLN